MEDRTFNTATRKDWNDKISNILRAIDLHNNLYFTTYNSFHKEQANLLRNYVKELKDWITEEEKNTNNS